MNHNKNSHTESFLALEKFLLIFFRANLVEKQVKISVDEDNSESSKDEGKLFGTANGSFK